MKNTSKNKSNQVNRFNISGSKSENKKPNIQVWEQPRTGRK